jgi:broad specificity phosphatase PhoE
LTAAATLLGAVGSPVLGAATLMGSSLASAQDRPHAADRGWRPDQSDAADRKNGKSDRATFETPRGQAAADDKDIAQALRAGGLVIVVRHGATFPDQVDTDPFNFENIAAQRNLNDKGRALAKAFGEALRELGIPVGKVYISKYNRGYETAVIAGFKDIEKTADLTEGGLVVSPNENSRRIEAFHTMLSTVPKPGTNTILITHKPNIGDALVKDWFGVKEGEASIFHPENGSYKLLARVQMDEWPGIAVAAK